MTTSNHDRKWLNNDEAAEYTGFASKTFNNSRYTGMLGGVKAPPFRKLGKAIRYERKALDEWLSQFKEQTSTSDYVA